jgi:hypothetical protein
LQQQPGHHAISDRNLVNVALLQLGKEVLWVHSARFDEALVTAALYLDARGLKSACNVQNNQCRCSPLSLLPGNPVPMIRRSRVSGSLDDET